MFGEEVGMYSYRRNSVIHYKSKYEIQRMKDAGKLAAEVLYETGLRVKAGISTLELNDFAHQYTIQKGAESAPLNYKGYPKSICTSVNNVVCHGIPRKDEILKEGDIININIPKGKLEVELSQEEINRRLAEWKAPEPKVKKGYLARYAKLVTSASTGAVLKN